jgi:hypothetical protein
MSWLVIRLEHLAVTEHKQEGVCVGLGEWAFAE